MFVSTHYGGEDLVMKFGEGEKWKKVFGPVFIYLNSVPKDKNDAASLWNDAKEQVCAHSCSSFFHSFADTNRRRNNEYVFIQMKNEVAKWPYSFPASEDFPHINQRGSVYGRLFVHDRLVGIII